MSTSERLMSETVDESRGVMFREFDATEGHPLRCLEAETRDGWRVMHSEYGLSEDKKRKRFVVTLQHLPPSPPPPPTLQLAVVLSAWLLASGGIVVAALL